MFTNVHEEQNSRFQERWLDTSIHMDSPFTQRYTDESLEVGLFDKIITSDQFDPFEIIGVSKRCLNFKDVRKQYKKKMVRYHPDKNGGETLKFDVINHAYGIVKKEIEKNIAMSCTTTDIGLKHQSEKFIQSQPKNINIDMKKFDRTKFNKLYEHHKLPEEDRDIGYGNWMKKKGTSNCPTKVKTKNFTSSFEKHKKNVLRSKNTAIIVHKNPEAYSTSTIGFSNVDPKSQKNYTTSKVTDLKHAYSEKHALIDTGDSEKEIRLRSNETVKSREKTRSKKMKPIMDEKTFIQNQNKEKLDKQNELKRLHRITARDKKISKHYKKINKLLISKTN